MNTQIELKGCISQILKKEPELIEELERLISNAKPFFTETENLVKKIKGKRIKVDQKEAKTGKIRNEGRKITRDNNEVYQG